MRKLHSQSTFFTINFLYVFVLVIPFILSSCQASQPVSHKPLLGTPNPLPPTPSPTPTPTQIPRSTSMSSPLSQSGHWNLIFDDEFNGKTLDTTKWNTCYFNFIVGNGCDHDQGELELYQPHNVSVSNGHVNLRADKHTVNAVNGKTYDYTSGMITTGPGPYSSYSRFTFTYGYVEMYAKLPAGAGLWPAFWLLPANLTWPPEIDIFEALGRQPNELLMTYHYPTAQKPDNSAGRTLLGPVFSSNWHTYAMQWEPGSITWYIDGVKRFSYTNSSAVTSQPMYLIANLAIGGSWQGSPTASTSFPSLYQIDYIRVWQK